MQRLEVSGAVRLIYKSLGVKGLMKISFISVSVNECKWFFKYIYFSMLRLNTG